MDVSSVSDYALELLGDGACGHVHSVFSSSFNVELGGSLVHVGTDDSPLSCLGLSVASEEMSRVLGMVAPRDGALWDRGVLVVRGRARSVALDVRRAERVRLEVPSSVEVNEECVAALLAELGRVGLEGRIGLPWYGEERSHIALASLTVFSAACHAGMTGESAPPREEAAARSMATVVSYLVGRGTGLTPSGDDVLAGFGCGLRFLYGSQGLAGSFFSTVGETFPGKTTAVSEAYLAAMCAGHANADYVELLQTLLSGRLAELPARTALVLRTGHTSGADSLLGFGAAFAGYARAL